MRRLISGRGRYALACLVVVGGLVTAGAQCQPTKPPAPTGLSIDPTSFDFGAGPTFAPKSFIVTNNGPDTSGTLTLATQGGDKDDYVVAPPGADNTCTGETLAKDATCTVVVSFVGSGAANQRSTDLVVSSDNPSDGQPSSALTGTVPE